MGRVHHANLAEEGATTLYIHVPRRGTWPCSLLCAQILEQVSSELQEAEEEQRVIPLNMIVIDSLSAVLQPVLGNPSEQARPLFAPRCPRFGGTRPFRADPSNCSALPVHPSTLASISSRCRSILISLPTPCTPSPDST